MGEIETHCCFRKIKIDFSNALFALPHTLKFLEESSLVV